MNTVKYESPEPITVQSGFIHVEKQGDKFTLLRDGCPYYIRGIGGNVNLPMASACGANSFRTWSPAEAGRTLDSASHYQMTVMMGIPLPKDNEKYLSQDFKKQKREETREIVSQYKNHPALLIWTLGNEINLGTNSQEAWEFVEELAQLIKSLDTNHPVCAVIAGSGEDVIDAIAQYAPNIDIIGLNVYAGTLSQVRNNCRNSQFKGAYAITEWGPVGHWEIENTDWEVPIEQTSSSKADSYKKGFEYIYENNDLFLGSYVFLWGQKQERTPTWYGMFVENREDMGLSGECCSTVDVMQYAWTGTWPENQAPKVTAIKINGLTAYQSVVLSAGEKFTAAVEVTEPDGDSMTFVWEVLKEATQLGYGGTYEPRPDRIGAVMKGTEKQISWTAPEAGQYRLFVYALDGKGHVGTANMPFRVQ